MELVGLLIALLGFVIWLVILVLSIVVPLASLVFWIWMIIDCMKNEPSEDKDKLLWALVVILAYVVGAAIYFFVRRPQRIAQYGH